MKCFLYLCLYVWGCVSLNLCGGQRTNSHPPSHGFRDGTQIISVGAAPTGSACQSWKGIYIYLNTYLSWSENIDLMVLPPPPLPAAPCTSYVCSFCKPLLFPREHIPGSLRNEKKEPQCLPCRCWGQKDSVKLKIAPRSIVIKAWEDWTVIDGS